MTKEMVEAALWESLAGLSPVEVCRRAQVTHDESLQRYACTCLGQSIHIDVPGRSLAAESPLGEKLLTRLGYFSRLTNLHYLVNARDLPLENRLVSPADLSSAQLYFRGSHVLPTDQVATAYGQKIDAFRARTRELGGQPAAFGDAAARLLPLPRIPIVVILWHGDDEFPPRLNLLFDATCKEHLAADVIWSIAMLTTLILMP